MTPAAAEQATLGGGCFWCTEAVFARLVGVAKVVSGYCGGALPEPTYEQICAGDTGHAEVVRIAFDPTVISYRELLAVFFAIHDPTTPNRQGNDVGSQYRSVIFSHSPEQAAVARALIADLEAEQVFSDPIVTEVLPLANTPAAAGFWPAEDYHQEYFARHREQGYCQFVVAPKLAKFRAKFRDRLKNGA
ncbi:peptide methionine sulfoxide reductase MsrA [mine drainage metagenome]|uniref:peptide-methionine (S)-S-oxide reductase n=1 Tax=mine drainage metagenome TaxID=410659 RepID=A0A1J5QEJ0_9ZZZZ